MARPRSPRVRLRPELVDALRATPLKQRDLASVAGFRFREELNPLLQRGRWHVLSPWLTERVSRLAALVGFQGELFS